eukprot:17678-Prymnesium_polylepis.1
MPPVFEDALNGVGHVGRRDPARDRAQLAVVCEKDLLVVHSELGRIDLRGDGHPCMRNGDAEELCNCHGAARTNIVRLARGASLRELDDNGSRVARVRHVSGGIEVAVRYCARLEPHLRHRDLLAELLNRQRVGSTHTNLNEETGRDCQPRSVTAALSRCVWSRGQEREFAWFKQVREGGAAVLVLTPWA